MMQCKRFWSIAIAVLILLTAATGYASAQAATPSSTATPTPLPSPPPTSAADPDVQIPAGWKRIEDDRLGYSLAVPFTWLTFDLHSGALDPIAGLLGGKIATDFLREFLDSPEGKILGILAIEPDITQLFANPPFPPFLNVSTTPWPEDLTAEKLVGSIQNSAENLDDVQLHSVMTGAVNGMPALRAVVTANLSGMGFDIAPYVVVNVLRANRTAYILTVATRVQTAAAKQPLIEQIVGTFRPTMQAQTAVTLTPMPSPTSIAATVVEPGTHLVSIDIPPGVYVGLAPEGIICTWERLNSLKGDSESIIAVDEHKGQFYVEVLADDLAFSTTCELSPIESVPARSDLLKSVPAGIYMVGRNIAPGLYRGEATADSFCTWERLSSVTGDAASVTSSGTPAGQYFVVVIASDYAVQFGCPVEIME